MTISPTYGFDSFDCVDAPWTEDQVRNLNAWQNNVSYHPYTCGRRDQPGHTWRNGDLGQLRATPAGWICDDCDYTQTWAVAFMVLSPPPQGFFS
jgi:hypothetical protein